MWSDTMQVVVHLQKLYHISTTTIYYHLKCLLHALLSHITQLKFFKNQFIGAVSAGVPIWEAAHQFKIPKSSAQDIWTKFKKMGSTENLPKTGHPPKVEPCLERLVLQKALNSCQKPFSEIANRCTPKISTSTIANILKRHNYHQRVAKCVPYLNKAHKHVRLVWAQICKAYKHNNRKQKIWLDECYFQLGDNKGCVFVTHRPGEEFLDECCVLTFSQLSKCVMVWGCIMKGKKGPLTVLEYPGGRGGESTQRFIKNKFLNLVYRHSTIPNIDKHINCMERCIQAVFATKGGHTPF